MSVKILNQSIFVFLQLWVTYMTIVILHLLLDTTMVTDTGMVLGLLVPPPDTCPSPHLSVCPTCVAFLHQRVRCSRCRRRIHKYTNSTVVQ